MTRLRVAFVVGSGHAYRVLNDLVDLGREHVDFLPVAFGAGRGALYDDMAARDVQVLTAGLLTSRNAPLAARRLRALLRGVDPQLIHSNLFLPSWATEMARLTWRSAPPSVLNRHHNLQHHYEGRRAHARVDGWTARRATAVAAVSRAVADTMATKERVPVGKIRVIHNGVDWQGFAAAPGASERWKRRYPGRELVIALGRLDRVKDVPTLLRAFQLVLVDRPQLMLVIAGAGAEDRALRAQVARMGLQDDVDFVGHVDDVPGLLAAADVFAQASIDEACPQSIAEALGLGVPVAVTTTGGTPELLAGSGHPLVPAGRADLLGERIRRLLSDPDRSRGQAATFAEVARERLSSRTMLENYRSLYREVLGADVVSGPHEPR